MKVASGKGRETLLRAWEGYGENFFSPYFFHKNIEKRNKHFFPYFFSKIFKKFDVFAASERGQPWKNFFICYWGGGGQKLP